MLMFIPYVGLLGYLIVVMEIFSAAMMTSLAQRSLGEGGPGGWTRVHSQGGTALGVQQEEVPGSGLGFHSLGILLSVHQESGPERVD